VATPVLIPAWTTGEVAPGLFGRQDLAKLHSGASTMRNFFAHYRGGAYSRPGTRFVGWSAQFGRPYPPRLIPFQFNINQGLILEFGNFYMRVILNGAFVTENPIPITNVTQANPGVVTAGGGGGSSATPVNTNVITSYSPGDSITLAGGTFTTPAVLLVGHTILLSCAVNVRGITYVPGDTITLAGGTPVTPAVVTVVTTQVVGTPTIAAAGTGGTPGNATVTGTTGVGTRFQATVTINAGGHIQTVNSLIVAGSYTTNPTVLGNEPVTGGGLTGAQLGLVMGVGSVSVSTGGDYTANPVGGAFTQASSSGFGTGATFQSAIFGPLTVSVSNPGVYTTFPPNPVSQASSTGGGLGAEFNVSFSSMTGNGLNTGDWVFIEGVQGMTELNGQTFIVVVLTPTTFQITDVFGNPVDTTVFPAYTGGGTIARIFTLPTIYADADLEYLKFVQSADVMTICCVNQVTGAEYPPQDLSRLSDTNWVFTPVVPAPSIVPPTGAAAINVMAPGYTGPNFPGQTGCSYAYEVTAVSSKDQTESVASSIAYIGSGAGDIAATAGSNQITWNSVPGAQSYNVYKAEPSYVGLPPAGSLFGFVGSSFGSQFVDSNITADFAEVPPLHRNPFARGQIINAVVDNPGTGFPDSNNVLVVINSGTGSGGAIEGVVVNGGVDALLILDPGQNYVQGDTIAILGFGGGGGATGHIVVGPQTGTYPSVPSYFQQRRVFGNSLNNPDTYWMSQPGAFTNFDSRIPTIDSDAITGTPWSLQVNGIQWFVLMPAGLATFTGLSAWVLVGSGSFATNVQPISPSSQVAQPLAFGGCSATLPPIKVNYDILYVTSKGSYYQDLPYQLYALSEPIDLTIFSSHLFDDFTFREHTWAETPFKLLWTIRSDNTLLSLTYLKQQQVAGWARHDTNGKFWSIASVVEPVIATAELGNPINIPEKADAVYFAIERHAG
jgi:Ubiquitin-activating enzyme E1 FCCH domain